jgi:NAD(P)-dependent dehydrogenase (short-subunit alcohol dehydrogenase family)
MTRQLAGRIVLVTGAPAGPGPAICRRLAAEGAWVGVNFQRDLESAKRLVDQIRSDGGRAMLVPGDVAIPAQAWAVVERIDLAWGPLDFVVEQSGAETEQESRIQNTESRVDLAESRLLPSIRLDAVDHLTRAALPALRQSPIGRIVVLGPADESLREASSRARAVIQGSEDDVQGLGLSADQTMDDVAAAVIRLALSVPPQHPTPETRHPPEVSRGR